MKINNEVIEKLKEAGIDTSIGCLYLLSVYFGLTENIISEDIKEKVNRVMIDRDYTNGGKPFIKMPLILNTGHDPLFKEEKEKTAHSDTGMFDEWMSLWPKPQETNLNYSVSGNKPQCRSRMNTFLSSGWKSHELPAMTRKEKWDVIIEATRRYIAYQKNRRWAYTKKNVKFINDLEGSVLAEWCLKVMNNSQDSQTTVLERMI